MGCGGGEGISVRIAPYSRAPSLATLSPSCEHALHHRNTPQPITSEVAPGPKLSGIPVATAHPCTGR